MLKVGPCRVMHLCGCVEHTPAQAHAPSLSMIPLSILGELVLKIQEYLCGHGMTDEIEQGLFKIEQKIFDNYEAVFTLFLFSVSEIIKGQTQKVH